MRMKLIWLENAITDALNKNMLRQKLHAADLTQSRPLVRPDCTIQIFPNQFSLANHFVPYWRIKIGLAQEDEPDSCDVGNAPELVNYEIRRLATSFACDLQVDPGYFKAIIGPKGSIVQQMRKETGCNISVPGLDSKATAVKITGPTRESVEEAIKSVMQIVESSPLAEIPVRKKRLEFDFFVSIPLLNETFALEIDAFSRDVKGLISEGKLSMEPSALMSPSKMHFTVCMLHLHTPERIKQAEALLQSLTADIHELSKGKALQIDWSQLQTFSGNLERADIIYLEPTVSTREILQPLANHIRSAFGKAGLVDDEKELARDLVLHVTVARARRGTDARCMAEVPSARFSPLMAREIHLSQRFEFDSNGFYHCASKVELE